MCEWIAESHQEDQIILYGRSAHPGVAARIASKIIQNCRTWIHDFSFYYNIGAICFSLL
ncbi:MAG: hypothetical protein IPG82_18100 [Saprospiraceae bacterium]|nr:hypothetical protein [Saprospiraceae bacterium]